MFSVMFSEHLYLYGILSTIPETPKKHRVAAFITQIQPGKKMATSIRGEVCQERKKKKKKKVREGPKTRPADVRQEENARIEEKKNVVEEKK